MSAPHPWTPEVDVDADLAAALLDAAFPGQFVAPLRAFGEGWDNVAFGVRDGDGGEWVARFPKRALGGALMEHELRLLPRLRAALQAAGEDVLDVPDLAFASARLDAAPRGYRWAFGVYRLLRGETACRAALPAPTERVGAAELGRFLGRLHGLAAELGDVAPSEPAWRADRAGRLARMRARCDEIAAATWAFVGAAHGAPDVAGFGAMVGALADVPGRVADALVHGDLYGRHVVVEPATGAPRGIIDWGDAHLGDAASDLALAWTLFDGAPRAAFLEAYRASAAPTAHDPHLFDRARLRAAEYAVLLLHFGQVTGEPELLGLGRDAWWGVHTDRR